MWPALRLLVVAIFLFGGAWPITKAALADATPMWFAVSRAGLATLFSLIVLGLLGRLHLPREGDWRAVLGLGFFQLGLFFAFTHLAVALVPAGRTAILSNVVAYWLIPLSMLLLGERVPLLRWLAAGASLAGAAVIVGPWSVDWNDPAQLFGYAMLILASLAWAIAIICTRKWPPRSSMLELLPWYFAIGAALLTVIALILEPDGGIGRDSWPHMLFIGIAAPIATWCVIEASSRLPGAVASVWFLLIPTFGVLVSALWLGEPIGWDVIVGGALIVVSVILVSRG
jgi:drug/metabolite transporter (DMT)-like permease